MVEAFSQRDIISNIISMVIRFCLVPCLWLSCGETDRWTSPLRILANSLVCGLVVGAFLACLVLLDMSSIYVSLRERHASLYQLLTSIKS